MDYVYLYGRIKFNYQNSMRIGLKTDKTAKLANTIGGENVCVPYCMLLTGGKRTFCIFFGNKFNWNQHNKSLSFRSYYRNINNLHDYILCSHTLNFDSVTTTMEREKHLTDRNLHQCFCLFFLVDTRDILEYIENIEAFCWQWRLFFVVIRE